MQATIPQPKRRNPKAGYVMYAADGRAPVIMEEGGHLFNESGEDLFHQFAMDEDRQSIFRNNILVWLDHNNFCVDHALRQNLVRAIREQQLQTRMERERAEARAREQAELAAMEADLAKARKLKAPKGPVAPAPQRKQSQEDLELTAMEEEVLGSMFESFEDPITGLPNLSPVEDEDEITPPDEEEELPAAKVTRRRR